MIRAEQISKHFTHPHTFSLFKDLSLELNEKESLAITGPSGIGKSTLLHILGTLESPSSGDLFIKNERVTRQNRDQFRREEIGFVFQLFHLFDDLSVLDNVLMPTKIARRENRNRAIELLNRVDLAHRIDHPTHLLSGGEKQRVSIARALVNEPSIILADEPTGNLDALHAKEIQDLLLECCDQCTLITVTHDMNFANRFDSILELEKCE